MVDKNNWGGITTAVRTEQDFDKANIEYIEFWMLDPFLDGVNGRVETGRTTQNNTTGGKLIFHLGTISEDVARDSRHAFENGLSSRNQQEDNAWGRVTDEPYLNNAFNSDPATRTAQDVGLDGLPDAEEQTRFGSLVPNTADPSGDNFRHYLDASYSNAKIIERYRDFNGLEGNSPVASGTERFTPSGSIYPDNEDINADNTLNELEQYYEYEMDLKKGQLDVGSKYIVDKIVTNPENTPGESTTWYLFRVPIRDADRRAFGGIEGFKSIRYVRMIMKGWAQPAVLRMVNFRMVGSKWRQYPARIADDNLIPTTDPQDNNDFTLSVVNLEENSRGSVEASKSPYVIPPGVVRDRDNTSAINRQLNEQSLQVCVENLRDGESRAVYKNAGIDLFNYGAVKMFYHLDSRVAKDGELYGFLRLGTDFNENYYEIQIPLKVSPVFVGMGTDEVWPEENTIDLSLNELYALKAQRDRESYPLTQPYPQSFKQVGRHLLR